MKHYSISQVAKILGVHRNTLFKWEDTKQIPAAKRNPKNGYRTYTQSDIVAIAQAKNIEFLNSEEL